MSHRNQRRGAGTIVLAVVALAACGGADDPTSVADAASEQGDVASGLVSPGEAAALAADPEVTVIDVRTPEEYADGHLAGATLIDFYADSFAEQIGGLDRDQAYLVYCRSGNRSGQATALMDELGFDQVYDIDGGVLAWGADGLPLDTP